MRINRYLSQCGLGSRRSVEDLVRDGRVRINGAVSHDLATVVDPENDRVEVDGRPVQPSQREGLVFLYHKPQDVVCSFRRQGRTRCLVDALPETLFSGRLFHVGRLDRDSTGLLLLSNDGDLAHRLLHPSHPVWKRYEIESDIDLSDADLHRFRDGGLELDGRACLPCGIEANGATAHGFAYTVALQEGRKRQIRRMIQLMGGQVLRLHRVAFGPVLLGNLHVGDARPARPDETLALREAAGLTPSRDR